MSTLASHSVPLPRKKGDRKVKIPISFIFSLYNKGLDDAAIMEQVGIVERSLKKAKAAIIALAPEEARRLYGMPADITQVLVDENLSPNTVLASYEHLGPSTHTNFFGLSGKDDFTVFNQAYHARYDVILTGDNAEKKARDLTIVAVAHAMHVYIDDRVPEEHKLNKVASYPLIVRFEGKGMKNMEAIGKYLDLHAGAIHDLVENRITPYIVITPEGIRLGPTVDDIRTCVDTSMNEKTLQDSHTIWVKSMAQKLIETNTGVYSDKRTLVKKAAKVSAGLCLEARQRPPLAELVVP